MTKRIKASDAWAALLGAVLAVGVAAFSGESELASPAPPQTTAVEGSEASPQRGPA